MNSEVLCTISRMSEDYSLDYSFLIFSFSFAIDRSKPTLVTRTGYERFQESMSNYLPSFYDIRLINTYYQCYGISLPPSPPSMFHSDKCPSKLSCLNGGMQDVNNCDKCKCPPGYNGNNCEQIVCFFIYLFILLTISAIINPPLSVNFGLR